MGTTKTTLAKKNYIFNKVNELSVLGLGYSYNKLIAEFILDCNSSRRTAVELLNAFVEAERFLIKDEKIYSLAFFNKDLTFKDERSNLLQDKE